MKIGIDFGGVIVMPSDGNNPFNPNLGIEIEMPNAIETIRHLIQNLKAEAWIVSKASKATQLATRQWLNDVEFYQNTEFNAANLKFCSKRSEKLSICQILGLTHFVDDHIEVLDNLVGIVPNLYLFGAKSAPNGITALQNWNELKRKMS